MYQIYGDQRWQVMIKTGLSIPGLNLNRILTDPILKRWICYLIFVGSKLKNMGHYWYALVLISANSISVSSGSHTMHTIFLSHLKAPLSTSEVAFYAPSSSKVVFCQWISHHKVGSVPSVPAVKGVIKKENPSLMTGLPTLMKNLF